MGTVDAIGEIARGLRYADGFLSHKIKLSDFQKSERRDRYDRRDWFSPGTGVVSAG